MSSDCSRRFPRSTRWRTRSTIPATSSADTSTEAAAVVRNCDEKLTRYRNLIDSGSAASKTVAEWISETEARRATAAAQLSPPKSRVLSRERIAELVDAAGDTLDALRSVEGGQKIRLYRALGLHMTYQPGQRKVLVGIAPHQHFVGENSVSEGRVEPYAHAGDVGGATASVVPRSRRAARHAAQAAPSPCPSEGIRSPTSDHVRSRGVGHADIPAYRPTRPLFLL